jgi:hypothetical protein
MRKPPSSKPTKGSATKNRPSLWPVWVWPKPACSKSFAGVARRQRAGEGRDRRHRELVGGARGQADHGDVELGVLGLLDDADDEVGIGVVDAEGHIHLVGGRALRAVGRGEDDVVGDEGARA